MAIRFDTTKCPVSRFGSYFSLSTVIGKHADLGDGLYVHTHHGGSTQAFKVETTREGRVIPFETRTTPGELVLEAKGGGEIVVVLYGNGVRIRGTGVALRLEMPPARWRFAYSLDGSVWGFNMSRVGIQFALEALVGSLEVDAPWEQGSGFCKVSSRMVAVATPAEDGTFEVAIDEFTTSWVKPERAAFEACRQEVTEAYGQWTKGLPEVAFGYETTRDLAGYVNWSAVVSPNGNLPRRTMLMSKISMCNVFAWDHTFNAMAHWAHDPDLSWDQLMVMFDKQDTYGKIPDNMNDRDIMYTFAKPPIHGWALRRMWDENPLPLTRDRMIEAYDRLGRWTNWWSDHRTWKDETLPYYIHGFDSGWDNSTVFDRGTPLVSPDLAGYMVLQLEVLSELARALGKETEADAWAQRSRKMLAALLDTLWRGDRFVAEIRPSGETVDCKSLITCMPMVLGRRLPTEIRLRLVSRIRDHLTPWGLSTEKVGSDQYASRGYWRGPIWAPSTMLVVSGLADIGEDALAQTIARSFCDMCVKSGFAENFDAETGEGHFDPAYTWTSSVFLILASRYC